VSTLNSQSERFIGEKQVRDRLAGISRAQLHRMRVAGQFPQPIKLSANRVVWPESIVNEWMMRKIAEAV